MPDARHWPLLSALHVVPPAILHTELNTRETPVFDTLSVVIGSVTLAGSDPVTPTLLDRLLSAMIVSVPAVAV